MMSADPLEQREVRGHLYGVWLEAQDQAYENAWFAVRGLACDKCFRANRGLRGPKHVECRTYYAAVQTVWDEWQRAKKITAAARGDT